MIPLQRFVLEHNKGKDHKYQQRYHFLDDLQLKKAERTSCAHMPDPVGRHLQTVLEKRNRPTQHNEKQQSPVLEKFVVLEPQMPIPGKGHKYIGADQQKYGINASHAVAMYGINRG
jgi:hypothetical protein